LAGGLYVAAAAAFFAVNGAVSKQVLDTGLPAQRLAEIRAAGAMVTLFGLVLATGAHRLRLHRHEVLRLAAYGVIGFALVQWLYFVSIDRLPVGIGLLFEFTAPVLVLVWERLGRRRPVAARAWLSVALAFGGLALVAEVWRGGTLDGLGVVAGLSAAVGLALYYVVGETSAADRDALSLTFYAFVAATLFWSVVRPWWTYPFGLLGHQVHTQVGVGQVDLPLWVLVGYVVLLGSVVPFVLVVRGLSHLPATRVGVLGMLEPPLAALVAWWWLGQSLRPVQLVGGAVVLTGIFVAQTTRREPAPRD
jgi:drug/metabolite transporter (DMT)-like permease